MSFFKNNKISKSINKYISRYAILYKILNLYFWKSLIGPIICFVVIPLFSIGMLYVNYEYASTIAPSVVSMPFMSLPFWLLISLILDLKKNSIVERIFVFSKKPIYPNIVVFIFSYLFVFISFLWNLLIIFLVSQDSKTFGNGIFINIDWFQTFYIAIVAIFVSVGISSMIYTYINNPIVSQIVGYVISAFFMFFSGSVIPTITISSSNALNYISYLSPFKYINSSLIISFNAVKGPSNIDGISIFDFGKEFKVLSFKSADGILVSPKEIVLFYSHDIYLNFLIPIFLSIIFLSFSLNKKMCTKK